MITSAKTAPTAVTNKPPRSQTLTQKQLSFYSHRVSVWAFLVEWLFSELWLRDPSSFHLVDHWFSTHGFQGCLGGGGLCSSQLEGQKGVEDCVQGVCRIDLQGGICVHILLLTTPSPVVTGWIMCPQIHVLMSQPLVLKVFRMWLYLEVMSFKRWFG